MSSNLSAPAVSRRESHGGTGLALAVLATAQFMLVLDNSVANVALPRIREALGFSESSLQYVVSLYALTFGGFLILAGRAADLFGRRRFFLLGIGLFSLASLGCGLAQSEGMLLTARALQGLGGAIASPAALSLVTTTFSEGPERNRALGIWGAVAASGAAAGLLIGGVLTEALSWRWVFLINIPVGVAVLLVAPRILPESRQSSDDRHLDLPGALLLTAALGLLIYGVTRGQEDGFGATSTLLLCGALACGLLWAAVEHRVQSPLVPLSFFKHRAVSAANGVGLLMAAVIAGQSFFATLYMQGLLGYSPIETGLAFLPVSGGAMAGASVASRAILRAGPRVIIAGGLGLVAVALGASLATELTTTYWLLAPIFLVFGLGLGLGMVGTTITATGGVDANEQGLASGMLNTSQQVGFAVGLAALVSVAVSTQESSMAASAAERVLDGYHAGWFVAAVVAAVGALLALLLIPRSSNDASGLGRQTPGEAACAACGPSGRPVTVQATVKSLLVVVEREPLPGVGATADKLRKVDGLW